MIAIKVNCWKCGGDFHIHPTAEYVTCPKCKTENIVGICANFVEIPDFKEGK